MSTALPALLAGLIDDAAVFPPGNAPLPVAVGRHRVHRRAPYAALVGPLLVPAAEVDALRAQARSQPEEPLAVSLISRPGVDPAVVVRTLGTRRDFGARQAFVTNLLAAGGIATVEEGAPVAILASSRSGYAEHGAAAVAALRAAGVGTVLVAGRVSELGDAASAVDGDVHDGIDVVAFLSDLLDHLGAPTEPETATDTGTTTEESR